uniref:Uncharacterized protein n=1 Tax=Meloidogyne incognita TaxID=6306 RepID=A0A914NVU9_MELIC
MSTPSQTPPTAPPLQNDLQQQQQNLGGNNNNNIVNGAGGDYTKFTAKILLSLRSRFTWILFGRTNSR